MPSLLSGGPLLIGMSGFYRRGYFLPTKAFLTSFLQVMPADLSGVICLVCCCPIWNGQGLLCFPRKCTAKFKSLYFNQRKPFFSRVIINYKQRIAKHTTQKSNCYHENSHKNSLNLGYNFIAIHKSCLRRQLCGTDCFTRSGISVLSRPQTEPCGLSNCSQEEKRKRPLPWKGTGQVPLPC